MARATSRSLWAKKLAGASDAGTPDGALCVARPRAADPIAPRRPFSGCVLGVDPSLRGAGLAVVSFAPGREPTLLASRTLNIPARHDMAHCLGEIYKAVADMIEEHPVAHCAYEETIYVQNFRTAQILGAARGAAIAAAAVLGKPVFEYAPLRVKQAVVGHGRADKEQVAGMIRRLLSLPHELPFDESDAAAVALCHAFTHRSDRADGL